MRLIEVIVLVVVFGVALPMTVYAKCGDEFAGQWYMDPQTEQQRRMVEKEGAPILTIDPSAKTLTIEYGDTQERFSVQVDSCTENRMSVKSMSRPNALQFDLIRRNGKAAIRVIDPTSNSNDVELYVR